MSIEARIAAHHLVRRQYTVPCVCFFLTEDEHFVGMSSTLTTLGLVEMDIAVVGLACRAPGGATDGDQLWELLMDGRC